MAQRIDGKEISKVVRGEVRTRAEAFQNKAGRQPGLHVVLVGQDAASQVYVRNKERAAAKVGIAGEVHRLEASTPQAELEALVERLSADPNVDGILVQLPLPDGLDAAPVLERINPSKDVDGLHRDNVGALWSGEAGLVPCTPQGCMRLLREADVKLEGAHAVVIGRSALVGKPIAALLLAANATVTVAHSRTRDLAAVAATADVLVAAVGRAKMVGADWIKPGAAVIDVGINRDESGQLCGDVDFDAVEPIAGAITPVPGGVGPMTIAMLLHNTVVAAERRYS